MLQLQIRTSSSEMFPIPDFHYLYEMARCSKCQMFILLKSTNHLYGFSDECCAIHDMPVPFKVDTDLMFRFNTVDKDALPKYQSFFVPDKYPFIIIPDYYWNMYVGGDLVAIYDQDMDRYILIDKTTNTPIDQFPMFERRYVNDFMRMNALDQMENYLNRLHLLGPEYSFYNLETNPDIRLVYDSKASKGRVLVKLADENTSIAFYLWKGMFALNKADTLSMEVRFDRYDKNTFMATFRPKRKANPMRLNTYGVPFEERVHCMYLNIAV